MDIKNCWFWDPKRQDFFRWKDLLNMWTHYCEAEKCYLAIGNGEPCNWCGKTEKSS